MLDEKFGSKDGEKLKKLLMIILVLASVLLMSNFASIRNTSAQTTAINKVASAGILAPPPLFPTNATFETKAEVVGNHSVGTIGGTTGADYVGQSFKALSDYIVNSALWLQNFTGTTPNFRLMLCNATELGWPNVASPMFVTGVITGATVNTRPGRFFFNLTEPIRVQQNRTYWLVIDGYYDNTTNGGAATLTQWYTGTYSDGYTVSSINAGASWITFPTTDLDFVVNFSNRPSKAEVFGTDFVWGVGGSTQSDYYAQSFKALDSYVVDAGIWIEKNDEPTPSLRVQIWRNNATGYPDKNNVIASSRVIKGSEINTTQGQRFFVHPNVSIPVVKGETYWLVIDGYYDQASAGNAGSHGDTVDIFKDGQFLFSNDAGSSWGTWSITDLNFIVTFSASQSAIKMMKGDMPWSGIGGNGINNYVGQSFKALNKYILDAGIWLENTTNTTPTIRLLICAPMAGNSSQPDLVNFVARSIPIIGQQISKNPGMQYFKPTKPITVVPGQTYFFIVDGYSLGNATAGNLRTYDRLQSPYGPYTDGVEMYSRNAGATWGYYTSYDLGLDLTFSDVPYEAQDGKNTNIFAVGGTAVTPYYAQSFVALNDYIADAGVSIIPYQAPTPDFQLLLCGNNATGSDHPDLNNVLAKSLVIRGTTIDANPGLFYVKPTTPVPVQRFQKYWIIIDGLTYNASSGQAQSEGVNYDAYPDGEFLWAFKDPNQGWFPYSAYDLHFDVTFTHMNQPPSQPPVLISPLKPFDSDDLYAYMSYGSTDLEQDPIAYYVEWYKNGVPQPAWANINTLPKGVTNATDNWTAKITPYDGHINGTAGFYTVHILADIQTIDHPVTPESITFHIFTTSNTTITGFDFHYTVKDAPANITFTATGLAGAKGFCNITIPKTLVNVQDLSQWMIMINGTLVPHTPPQVIITENATYTFISLSYTTSSVPIMIQGLYAVPEFTPTILIATLAIATMAVAVITKKINKKKQ